MLAFVQQILAFTTFEVLEPNSRKLENKLESGKVETVDQLLRDHVDFLDTCLKECMLTSDKLLKVCKLGSLCFRLPANFSYRPALGCSLHVLHLFYTPHPLPNMQIRL
jgi:hypothetical protein